MSITLILFTCGCNRVTRRRKARVFNCAQIISGWHTQRRDSVRFWPRNLLNESEIKVAYNRAGIACYVDRWAGSRETKEPGNHQTISSLFFYFCYFRNCASCANERCGREFIGTVPMLFRLSRISYSHYLRLLWRDLGHNCLNLVKWRRQTAGFHYCPEMSRVCEGFRQMRSQGKILERNEQSRFPPSPFQPELE